MERKWALIPLVSKKWALNPNGKKVSFDTTCHGRCSVVAQHALKDMWKYATNDCVLDTKHPYGDKGAP
uniref:Uncharacterized protein n=1 Tax=Cucumis melo TaxID=3656 RepID=A0A9I9DL80_CUCME